MCICICVTTVFVCVHAFVNSNVCVPVVGQRARLLGHKVWLNTVRCQHLHRCVQRLRQSKLIRVLLVFPLLLHYLKKQ